MFQGPLTSQDLKRGQGPQAYADPQKVLTAFRIQYPGESGTRNPLRGDGYFGLDAGLSKVFPVRERVRMRLRWDVFNVTNSVRFDVGSIGNRLDQPTTFGAYTQTLTNPRVMQVALRVEFWRTPRTDRASRSCLYRCNRRILQGIHRWLEHVPIIDDRN